ESSEAWDISVTNGWRKDGANRPRASRTGDRELRTTVTRRGVASRHGREVEQRRRASSGVLVLSVRYCKLVMVSWNGAFTPLNGCTSAYQVPAVGLGMSIDSYTPALSDLKSYAVVVGGTPCFT